MLPLYAIEVNMPFLSNVLSTGKMKRRARKVPKYFGDHSGTSGWTTSGYGSIALQAPYIRISSASRGEGAATYSITVENGVKYRFIIHLYTTSDTSNEIRLGTSADDDAYATLTGAAQTFTGSFVASHTSLRVKAVANASKMLRIGKILIEEL